MEMTILVHKGGFTRDDYLCMSITERKMLLEHLMSFYKKD